MNILEAIILGLIQGITEFFPVSSSGHLLLIPEFLQSQISTLNFENLQSNSFDILLHIATYFALLVMYRKEILMIVKGIKKRSTQNLIRNLIITSIPVIVIGGIIFVTKYDERQNQWVGVASLVLLGIVFVILDLKRFASADIENKENLENNQSTTAASNKQNPNTLAKFKNLTPVSALIIGFFQASSVIRGMSRSGATFLGGLSQKLSRREALDYSFLASLPVFFVLTTAEVGKMVLDQESLQTNWSEVFIGGLTAFIAAIITIKLFRNFIEKRGVLLFFGIYRILLAGLIAASLLQSS